MRNQCSKLAISALLPVLFTTCVQAEIAPIDPAGAAPTNPATQPTTQAAASDPHHKHLDEHWRQFNESLKTNQKTRYAETPILRTFKPGALINLSLSSDMLKIDTTDLATPIPARVAVEGSKAVWVLSRPTGALANAAAKVASMRPYLTLSRFDFDAKDDESWQARILLTDQTLRLWAQNTYNNTTLTQSPGSIKLRVCEYAQMGQAPQTIVDISSPTLTQLRNEHPQEFRLYALPLLARFSDPSFLLPGAADAYATFVEIPADQKVSQELDRLIPSLDADDPADRDSATARLYQLGSAGILAALRTDAANLSEEQKLRVAAFIASARHRAISDPQAQRHDKAFLIDCLESDDSAIRAAAKAELQRQSHQNIDFDLSLTGDDATTAADLLRERLLAPTAPPPATQPTTQPVPQA